MATAQRPSAKSNATPTYETVVEQQLAQANRRLRMLDLAAWGMILACAIVGYGLVLSFADRLWNLPTGLRLALWCCFVIVVIGYMTLAIRRLVLSNVNPHFVARQLEQTIPEAKNSVINWLDLRGEPLAPVIRGSLGRRAAKDLSKADMELALSSVALWWIGSALAILVLVQVGWLIAAPGPVRSLLQRAFLPFDKSDIAASTTLQLIEPAGGDIRVPANQSVQFKVQATGYVPALNQKDSLKLHFRYHQSEPFEERSLVTDNDGNWTTVVHADQVRNGFWYKITGGDAHLPADREFRVDVRPIAQVVQFEAAFKYRDYLRLKDKTVVYDKNVRPSVSEMRGTEITLTVHANRDLKHCAVQLKTGNQNKTLPGEPVPGDDEAWRFKWVLDQSGEFRILFESNEGEPNVDRQPCKVEVVPDRPPEVVLTKPAADISLPANGTLAVEGNATDDFGVKSMQLCLKLLKAPTLAELKPKLYRPDTKFQLVNGKYPLKLEYSDFLPLDSLQTVTNEPYRLAAGMELEYWLEARDNCDYPDKNGNLGRSLRYKLVITPPETDKNQTAAGRSAAQQKSQEKQKNQDKNLEDQNTLAQAEKDAAEGGGGKQSGKGDQNLDQQAKDVEKAIEDANKPGSSKGDSQDKGEAKDKGPQEGAADAGSAKDKPPDGKSEPDQAKGDGQQGPGNESAQAKDRGAEPGKEQQSAQGKEAGDQQKSGAQGKDADPKKGGGDGAKTEPKTAPKDNAATAKDQQKPGASNDPAKEKGPGGEGDKKDTHLEPGSAKGATPTDKSAPKNTPTTTEQIPGAKGGEKSNQPPPADAKLGPGDPSQAAGEAKTSDRKDATADDVAKLREWLKDPANREVAKKALDKISDQAADPKVRDAADKALDEAKAEPGAPRTAVRNPPPPPARMEKKRRTKPARTTQPRQNPVSPQPRAMTAKPNRATIPAKAAPPPPRMSLAKPTPATLALPIRAQPARKIPVKPIPSMRRQPARPGNYSLKA